MKLLFKRGNHGAQKVILFHDERVVRPCLEVDLDLIFDELGTLGKSQRADGLFELRAVHGPCDDQGGLAVATQRVLKKPCKLGVSEWNMLLILDNTVNDFSKSGKRRIDLLGFLKLCS